MDAQFFIQHLNLLPHPEGGYFKEVYRAAETIAANALPQRFSGSRSFSTSIYYLLQQGDFSTFHRIKSDECWHYYAGETLLVHMIDGVGKYSCVMLGQNIEKGETFQFVVPAGVWFASEPASGTAFSLVGCTVSPGFDFDDFEIADRSKLLSAFSQHNEIIQRLTR
jgi:predicted cupin superfamily sugar epimerase